jgi:hypothetical protein
MARRSSLAPKSLQIRRDFLPSRSQLQALAFAFEQALPLIRKPLPGMTSEQNNKNSDVFVLSSATGARS